MADWIQGHELGRRFKALVCHDGVFSTQNQWSTEELFFPMHDFGGTLWEKRDHYAKWDPSLHLHNWETPQLVSRPPSLLRQARLMDLAGDPQRAGLPSANL